MFSRLNVSILSICLVLLIGVAGTPAQRKPQIPKQPTPSKPLDAALQWLQWGGPHRNFKVTALGLKETWPAEGPKQLWSRSLGEGHSAILFDNGRLYTGYSNGDQESVVCLDAATGKTIWDFKYEAKKQGLDLGNGSGPHSTPLIVGDIVYAIGVRGTMHSLEKKSGRMIWKHDLWSEFNGHYFNRGYSPSPIAYKNTVIVPVGGGQGGQCLMAFDQKTGNVAWMNLSFKPAPASPVVINIGGQDQLVGFGFDEVYGADPNNGNLLWSYPHKTAFGLNISTPVWGPDNILFISSAYDTGSRGLQLARNGNQTTVREIWANKRMRVHIGTVVRIDHLAYGSSGDFGPAFFTAIDVKTGKIAWQERGLARANFVHADAKLVILDEDGTLAIATPTPTGLKIHSKAPVLKSTAWTAPTLVGTKVFLRDRKTIIALDLG